MVIAIFATQREIAFPYRIGEDKFCGPEVVAAVGVALDGTRGCSVSRCSGCLLCGATRRLGVVEESVDIEVDTQLAHLAVIVGIEDVLAETLILPNATL